MCPHLMLDAIKDNLQNCTKCLLSTTRKNIVFGSGCNYADIVFVGEAPGENEDLTGRPFVGRAGKRLDEALQSIGLTREEVYICNILKCRPPENRDPLPSEIAACQPVLIKQLDIIKPKIIVALGAFAAQTLLKTTATISEIRGQFFSYRGIPVLPTWHPAYTLYNNSKKLDLFADFHLADLQLSKPH